ATPARRSAGEKGAASTQPFASVLFSGKDRKAYLIVDGTVTFETPIGIFEDAKPLGTHLYSLVGLSKYGLYMKWNSFDICGVSLSSSTVDLWTDPVLARVEYLDAPGVRTVAKTLRPGTTMVITDFAATPETRTGPDFTVITEDRAVPGKRVRGWFAASPKRRRPGREPSRHSTRFLGRRHRARAVPLEGRVTCAFFWVLWSAYS